MIKKTGLMILVILIITGTAYSQSSSFNMKIGKFIPSLKSDLWEVNMENLIFEKEDMQGIYFGAEYEYFIDRNLSFSLEAGIYKKEHNSMYRDYTDQDSNNILQSLSLRIASFEANVKIYPSGYRKRLYPYFGAGVGLYSWQYEQWGDFINFEQSTIDEGYSDSSKTDLGFNLRAGFVYRFRRTIGLSAEVKYLYLKGRLSTLFEGFEKLDMRGLSVMVGINLFMN